MPSMKNILTFILLLGACCLPAFSQLVVTMTPIKKQFISGEPVMVRLTISNNTGAPVKLTSNDQMSWLDINVETTEGGIPLPQSRFANFPPLSIPTGKSVSRRIDMRHFYDFSRDGYYKATALVRSPDMRTMFSSGKQMFSIMSGMPVWSQLATPPGGRRCKYVVSSMKNNQKSHLYVQVRDGDTGIPINATGIGEWLSFFDPSCRLDSKGFLHVLFLTTPTIYAEAVIAPDGVRKSLQYFKRITGTQPVLVYLPDGSLRVAGAQPFNPFKQDKQILRDATSIPGE